jgi:hypothetical protein
MALCSASLQLYDTTISGNNSVFVYWNDNFLYHRIAYEHGPGDNIKSLQLTGLFTCFELAEIIVGLILATPVTFTLLYDVRMGLLPHENFAVILFCPCLITVGAILLCCSRFTYFEFDLT